jgi:hypothetical protein
MGGLKGVDGRRTGDLQRLGNWDFLDASSAMLPARLRLGEPWNMLRVEPFTTRGDTTPTTVDSTRKQASCY